MRLFIHRGIFHSGNYWIILTNINIDQRVKWARVEVHTRWMGRIKIHFLYPKLYSLKSPSRNWHATFLGVPSRPVIKLTPSLVTLQKLPTHNHQAHITEFAKALTAASPYLYTPPPSPTAHIWHDFLRSHERDSARLSKSFKHFHFRNLVGWVSSSLLSRPFCQITIQNLISGITSPKHTKWISRHSFVHRKKGSKDFLLPWNTISPILFFHSTST